MTTPIGAKIHDPTKVRVSFGGRTLDLGRDEGDFVTTAYTVEQVKKHVGANGEVTVSVSADQSGTATINCMSSSDTHRLLTALADQQRTLGVAFAVFQILDANNQIVERSRQAWIEKAPDNAYGAEVGKRAWVIGLARLERSAEGVVLT